MSQKAESEKRMTWPVTASDWNIIWNLKHAVLPCLLPEKNSNCFSCNPNFHKYFLLSDVGTTPGTKGEIKFRSSLYLLWQFTLRSDCCLCKGVSLIIWSLSLISVAVLYITTACICIRYTLKYLWNPKGGHLKTHIINVCKENVQII